MSSAGVISVVYGLAILMGALATFIQFQQVSTLILEVAVGSVLLTVGWRAWREPGVASFAAAIVTFLAALFFAFRFLTSNHLIPALLLLVGFVALFGVLLGVFIQMQRDSEN